jgi:hypothetical protein
MMLTTQQMPDGNWLVTDGNDILTVCPCCGKDLNERAAKALVKNVESGKAPTFAALLDIASWMLRAKP